jgi:hypothetical protein
MSKKRKVIIDKEDKLVSTSMYSPRIIFDAGDKEDSDILAQAFDKYLAKKLANKEKN